MRRRRRSPSPGFRVPPPYTPFGGKHAQLGGAPDLTRTALFQVLEVRTDYLVCRGFDPESGQFLNQVSVAKPWLLQKTPWDGRSVTYPDDLILKYAYLEGENDEREIYVGVVEAYLTTQMIDPPYFVGDILTCAKPQSRLGTSPGESLGGADVGVAEEDRVIVIMDDDEGKLIWWQDLNVGGRMWLPAQMPSSSEPPEIMFQLTANLVPGGTAAAKLLEWDETTDNWVAAEDGLGAPITFTVADVNVMNRAPTGARGQAQVHVDDAGEAFYEVIWVQPQATWLLAYTDMSVASGDATYTFISPEIMQPFGGLMPSPAPTTANNTLSQAIGNGDLVILAWNEDDDDWDTVTCEVLYATASVITDLQVDGANAELEKKTRTLTIPVAGTESAWTVWHTGDEC